MTYVRVDDGYFEHPKVQTAGDEAAYLFLCALGYASRNLTDGFVPAAALPRLTSFKRPAALAAKLVNVNLFEHVEGGWQIHKYAEWQRTRAEVDEYRARNADKVKKWRERNRARNADVTESHSGCDPVSNPPIATATATATATEVFTSTSVLESVGAPGNDDDLIEIGLALRYPRPQIDYELARWHDHNAGRVIHDRHRAWTGWLGKVERERPVVLPPPVSELPPLPDIDPDVGRAHAAELRRALP
jgi:hypothetical protein